MPRLEMVEQNVIELDEPNEERPQTSQPQILSCQTQPSVTTSINIKKNTLITTSSRFIFYKTYCYE